MRPLLVACVILAGGMALPIHARAQVVVACPTCADLVDQLVEKATQARQLATEAATLQTSLNQYSQMVTAGLTLPNSIYSNVQADINSVRSLANAASLLTGNSGSILARLQSAQAYANQVSSIPSNIGAQFTMWQQTLGNASNALGRTLGVQQGQQQNYAALQAAIAAHATTAAGQMQAISVGNETLGLISTQLNQTQTTLTAAAQEQATRNAIAAERRALADQYFAQFIQQPDASLTGFPRYR